MLLTHIVRLGFKVQPPRTYVQYQWPNVGGDQLGLPVSRNSRSHRTLQVFTYGKRLGAALTSSIFGVY